MYYVDIYELVVVEDNKVCGEIDRLKGYIYTIIKKERYYKNNLVIF